MIYTKEFLVEAIVYRYAMTFDNAAKEKTYREMCNKHYDAVGKDKFREHASLDAEALREYKESL